MSEEELRRRIKQIFDVTRIPYEGVYESDAENMLVELFQEKEGETSTFFELANRIELVKTCEAAPEQYDAFLDGEQVGYLRVRWGYFSVYYLHSGGEEIYDTKIMGDGMFEDDERDRELMTAKMSLAKKIKEEE